MAVGDRVEHVRHQRPLKCGVTPSRLGRVGEKGAALIGGGPAVRRAGEQALAIEAGEPVVQIVEVKVPVAIPCDPDIGPEPAYVDTPEAIAMAPDIFARTVLLLAGRVQRIARDGVKTTALDECRRPPAVPPRPG